MCIPACDVPALCYKAYDHRGFDVEVRLQNKDTALLLTYSFKNLFVPTSHSDHCDKERRSIPKTKFCN